MQRLLQLRLGVLRERRLQHGPAVLAEGLHGLVRRDLLNHDEQSRGTGLEHVPNLLLELLVDPRLLDLAEQGSESGANRHSEYRNEEQQAEQKPPEHSPRGSSAHRVVRGAHVVLALLVAHDGGDSVGLDDQLARETLDLLGREGGGGLIGVADGD